MDWTWTIPTLLLLHPVSRSFHYLSNKFAKFNEENMNLLLFVKHYTYHLFLYSL